MMIANYTVLCPIHTNKTQKPGLLNINISYYPFFEQRLLSVWGGGSAYTKSSAYPYLDFLKCPLHSSMAQANLFAILTVSRVLVIDLCFLASF